MAVVVVAYCVVYAIGCTLGTLRSNLIFFYWKKKKKEKTPVQVLYYIKLHNLFLFWIVHLLGDFSFASSKHVTQWIMRWQNVNLWLWIWYWLRVPASARVCCEYEIRVGKWNSKLLYYILLLFWLFHTQLDKNRFAFKILIYNKNIEKNGKMAKKNISNMFRKDSCPL